MANVIEILLRSRDEASRQIAQVAQTTETAEARLMAFASTASTVTIAAAAIGSAFVGVYNAAKSLTDQLDDLQRRAGRTGVDIESIQALDEVLSNAGISAETGTQALTFLNRAIATQDPLLKALGISTRDTLGAFLQLNRTLAGIQDQGLKTEIAYRLMGRSSGDLLAVSASLAGALPAMRNELIGVGAAISASAVPAIENADRRMESLERRAHGFANALKEFAATAIAIEGKKLDIIVGGFHALTTPRGGSFPGGPLIGPPDPGSATINATEAMLKEIKRLLEETDKAGQKTKLTLAQIADIANPLTGTGQTQGAFTGGFGLRGSAPGMRIPQPVKETTLNDSLVVLRKYSTDSQAIMTGAAQGIATGFDRAFAQITAGTFTLKSALVTIVTSMVDEILSQLARLAAREVIIGLFNLFDAGLGGSVASFLGLGASPAGSASRLAAGRAGDTYVFNGFSVGDVYREAVRPGGSIRRAGDRLMIGQAY